MTSEEVYIYKQNSGEATGRPTTNTTILQYTPRTRRIDPLRNFRQVRLDEHTTTTARTLYNNYTLMRAHVSLKKIYHYFIFNQNKKKNK